MARTLPARVSRADPYQNSNAAMKVAPAKLSAAAAPAIRSMATYMSSPKPTAKRNKAIATKRVVKATMREVGLALLDQPMLRRRRDQHAGRERHEDERKADTGPRTRREERESLLNDGIKLEADQDLHAHDRHARLVERELELILDVRVVGHGRYVASGNPP